MAPSGPLRSCVGCGTKRSAHELERVVRAGSGELLVGRLLPGRGAWLCRDSALACAKAAARSSRWSRALRGAVSKEQEEELLAVLAAAGKTASIR